MMIGHSPAWPGGPGWLARRPRAGARPTAVPWMTIAAVLISAATLVPLGFIVVVTLKTGWVTASSLVLRPRVGELLVNTVLLVALTVPATAVVSVGLAWLTERSNLPGARL